MLSSRVSSALFVFFCFVVMTDEVLTTPDEVSELKSKNAAQSMQIASLNEQVAKLTKTSSTNNLDEAELGEWLRAGRGGHLAPTQKASISRYLSSLAEAQKQCPASRLQCPSSKLRF